MTRRARRLVSALVAAAVAATTIGAMADLGLLNPATLQQAAANTRVFLDGLFPPATAPIPTLADALVETLQIAFVGTMLGAAAALPAGLLGTRTLLPRRVTAPAHGVMSLVRTVPTLLWGVLFVVAFGLGPAAGTLGIAAYTLGFLGKLFADAFEGVDPEVVDAVRSTGCNRAQLLRHALLPEAANVLMSQLIFAFEYNVRASTILGFVGAGGIGFYMLGYVQMLQYRNLMTALLLTLGVVIVIEAAGGWIRKAVRMR